MENTKKIMLYWITLLIFFFGLCLVPKIIRASEYNSQVYQIQMKLEELGYNPGPVDGYWGNFTKNALKEYQRDNELSPTGKRNNDTLLKLGIFDDPSKPVVFVETAPPNSIYHIGLSKNGKFAFFRNRQSMFQWDVFSGKEIRRFTNLSGSVVYQNIFFGKKTRRLEGGGLAISPNGEFVVSGVGNLIKIWNISTGLENRILKGHNSEVHSFAFSPDGEFLASASSLGIVKLWDFSTGEEIKSFRINDDFSFGIHHIERIDQIVISPDRKSLLIGGDAHEIELWDISTGQRVQQYEGTGAISFGPDGKTILGGVLAFSLDGKYAVEKSKQGSLILLDASTNQQIRSFNCGQEVVLAAFSPDNKMLITNHFGSMIIWDVSSGKEIRKIKIREDRVYEDRVYSVAFSPDGKYALSGSDNKGIWEFDESIIGKYALSRFNNKVRLWDISNGSLFRTLNDDSSRIQHVSFSPDGKYVFSGNYGESINQWKISTGQCIQTIESQGPFCISPEGKLILIARNNKTLELTDLANKKNIRIFHGASNEIESLAFSPNGKYAISASPINENEDVALKLWDVLTGKKIRTFKGICYNLRSITFSPDSNFVLGGGQYCSPRIWDVSTGQKIRTYLGPGTGRTTSVAYSPNGEYILSGSFLDNYDLKLWNASTGKRIRMFIGHTGDVESVAFSSDSKYAISGSDDRTMRLWEVKTGKEIAKFISFNEDEWVVITPEGFFNASQNGGKILSVKVGNEVYSIDQFYDKLYRPDLVELKLKGDPNGILSAAASKLNLGILLAQGGAPKITIISPKSGISKKRDITVQAMLIDSGGGIGKTVWKLNGQTIDIFDNDRGVKIHLLRRWLCFLPPKRGQRLPS